MHVSEWVVRIDKPTWFSIYRAKGMCSLRSRGSKKRTEQPNKHLSVQTNKRTTLDSQQIFNYFQLKSWSRTIVWLNQSDWLHFHRTFCIIQSLAQTVFNFLKYQIGREMNKKKKINVIIISGPIEHPFFLWDTHRVRFQLFFSTQKITLNVVKRENVLLIMFILPEHVPPSMSLSEWFLISTN